MKRREFLSGLTLAIVSPRAASSQQTSAVRRIGILINADINDPEWTRELSTFLEQMKRFGWTDGANMRIDYRNGGGNAGRISDLSRELVALKPDVIVSRSTPATRALAPLTRTIPIVFLSVSDPIGEKFIDTLAKPGGNMTGFTNVEASMGSKWLELLKEAVPSINRAIILLNPNVAPERGEFYLRTIRIAASKLDVVVEPVPVTNPAEIESAVVSIASQPRAGLVVMPDPFIVPNRALVIELAARYRIPAVYGFRNMALEGGLMSYGVDLADMLRRSAEYVDRILRGEKAADLPVQTPIKYDLVVNLKTAKAIGLKIPEAFLLRADELIE